MSAEIIPFVKDRPRAIPRDIQAAWDELDAANRVMLTMLNDPNSTSRERLEQSLKVIKLGSAFRIAAEAWA